MKNGVKLDKSMEGQRLYAVGRGNAKDRGTTTDALHPIEVVMEDADPLLMPM